MKKFIIPTLLLLLSFMIGMLVGYTILEMQREDIVKDRIYLIVVEEDEIRDYLQDYIPDEESVEAIAKTLYGECRGVESTAQKAAVAWVILNRVDAGFGETVLDVVSEPNQFLGYNPDYPVTDELRELAEDVLIRWQLEKEGVAVGRVLPEDYLWFRGDGEYNYFRNDFYAKEYWDWSLENPYED